MDRTRTWADIESPQATTTTDADGKFELEVPFSDFALFAVGTIRRGDKRRVLVWVIPDSKITDRNKVILDGTSLTDEIQY